MPKFTKHVDSGTLRLIHLGYVLEEEGGGFWVLEMWSTREPQQYLDQRVIVEGTRVGFNILSVDRIWRQGEERPVTWMEKAQRVIVQSLGRMGRRDDRQLFRDN